MDGNEELMKEMSELVDMITPTESAPVEEPTPVVEESAPAPEAAPVESAPAESAPVEAPAPAQQESLVPEESETEALRRQNERLLQTINELTNNMQTAPTPVRRVQEQKAQEAVEKPKVELTEEQFADIMSDPAKFASFISERLADVEARAMQALNSVVENVLPSRVGSIVQGEVAAQRVAEAKARKFFAQNPDLAPHAPFVAQRHLEVIQQNPSISEEDALKEAARISRQLLGKEEPKKKLVDANPVKPAFVDTTGVRPAPAPNMSEIQKEMLDLLS
jgi:hypothetical protein